MRRFDKGPCYMEENDEGKYVLYSDHAAELTRVEAERDANRRLLNKALKENALLRAECEKRRVFWKFEMEEGLPHDDPKAWARAYCEAEDALVQAMKATDAAGALKGVQS